MKQTKTRFAIFVCFTYMAAFWTFSITTASLSGPINKDGLTLDQYGVGLATMTSFVVFTHMLLLGQMRDWNKVIIIITSVIIGFYFIALLVAQNNPLLGTFHKHLIEVISQPLFWLSIPPAVFLMILPYYFERLYWRLLRHP